MGVEDVTPIATWSAAEAWSGALDTTPPMSSAVDFATPGVVSVLRPANVYIRADYASSKWGPMRSIAPLAYAVESTALPVPLAYITGNVIPGGVTIEIIDGEGKGKKDVSRENGFYLIEFLRLSVAFTARASKPGYTPDVKTHPGIVVSESGYPTNAYLHFNLSPLQ